MFPRDKRHKTGFKVHAHGSAKGAKPFLPGRHALNGLSSGMGSINNYAKATPPVTPTGPSTSGGGVSMPAQPPGIDTGDITGSLGAGGSPGGDTGDDTGDDAQGGV
jgi:hypothetical protein